MELTTNYSMSTEDRTKLYNSNKNIDVEKQNTASAENASKISISGDTVDVRNSVVFEGESLTNADLMTALEQLTSQLVNNGSDAFSAQGNLDTSSVLALLED